MAFLYKVASTIFLVFSHILSYQLSEKFIRPIILPLIYTTNNARLASLTNRNLQILHIDHHVVNNQIDSIKVYGESRFVIIAIDVIMSLSVQLIGLFLFDILRFCDFSIRHLDCYITLVLLTIGLVYVIPVYILYKWIQPTPNNTNLVDYSKVILAWILVLVVVYLATSKEMSGTYLQLSLYLVSLFGICCLSILNGIGCVMSLREMYEWFHGIHELLLSGKEEELIRELKSENVDLIKAESLSRELVNIKNGDKGIGALVTYTTWIYSIYKIGYGIIRVIQFMMNIVQKKKGEIDGNGDLLASTIAHILGYNGEQITMIINFLISVSFFLMSIQNVLITFKNLRLVKKKLVGLEIVNKLQVYNESVAILDELYQELIPLVLCEMTGIYVISTALMLNTKLPIHLTKLWINEQEWSGLKMTLDSLDVDFMNDWFDKWFVIGSTASILIFTLFEKIIETSVV